MQRKLIFRVISAAAIAAAAGFFGCETEAGAPRAKPVDRPNVAPAKGVKMMTLQITSTAFAAGERVPTKHTGEGEDVSPPLAWSDLPPGTKELALICDDPDAPTKEPWVHWVIYKIPPELRSLPEGIPARSNLQEPAGPLQGKNSWPNGRTIGYRGPMPPPGHGQHRYFFRLYALDAKLSLPPGASKAELLDAMQGHVLGEGELLGTYSR